MVAWISCGILVVRVGIERTHSSLATPNPPSRVWWDPKVSLMWVPEVGSVWHNMVRFVVKKGDIRWQIRLALEWVGSLMQPDPCLLQAGRMHWVCDCAGYVQFTSGSTGKPKVGISWSTFGRFRFALYSSLFVCLCLKSLEVFQILISEFRNWLIIQADESLQLGVPPPSLQSVDAGAVTPPPAGRLVRAPTGCLVRLGQGRGREGRWVKHRALDGRHHIRSLPGSGVNRFSMYIARISNSDGKLWDGRSIVSIGPLISGHHFTRSQVSQDSDCMIFRTKHCVALALPPLPPIWTS